MMKIRKRKQQRIYWGKLLIFGVLLVVTTTSSGVVMHHVVANQYYTASLTKNEIQKDQTTIPSDMLAQIYKHQDVLGASSYPSPKGETLVKPQTKIYVPILMYHYIEYVHDQNDTMRIKLDTTPYTLEQQILTLKNAGYTFITNEELASVLNGKTILPAKPILLTFDDGYRDFYTDCGDRKGMCAYQILQKYHVKATEYIISGFLSDNPNQYPNNMLISQIQIIASDSLVEIGAHTVHHRWLRGQSLGTVSDEVLQSKQALEKIIHKPVVSFAYPYGAFDQQAINVVKSAGFTSAVSTVPGIDQSQINKYFLYRLRPGGLTGQALLDWLASVKNNSY